MSLTMMEAQSLTLHFLKDYPEGLELAYRFRQNTAELYGSRANEVPEDLKGGYIPKETIHNGRTYRGRIEIPLDNQHDSNDFLATLRHEIIGHYGINTFHPSEKRVLLDTIIYNREESTLKPFWERANKIYGDKILDIRAEEIFSVLCEEIAPSHHINDSKAIERGLKSFQESCIARIRPMQADDLRNIACMVAQGLHDRTRTQKTFPSINEQFRRDSSMEPKKSFHEVVAEKLIEQLKAGTAPWQKPWKPGSQGFMPINPTTGKRYKGVNAIHLMAQGRSDNRWMTYKQAKAVGAQVRRGERGTNVQYFKFFDEKNKLDDNGKPVLDEEGKPVKEIIMLDRPKVFSATVFNGEQINGMPPLEPKEQTQSWNAVERAENILMLSGADIRHGEHDRAFYRPSTDSIHLPDKEQFSTADNYYATALHELGHWTGHSSRLNRDMANPFGSEGYAKEELRAECFSLIMGDELGIGHDPGQHAAYVGSWIKVLQDEPLEIFRAASDAEKMSTHVLAFEQKLEQDQIKEKNLEVGMQLPSSTQSQSVTDKPELTYINVPYREKDEARKLGARWDRQQQSWFVPSGVDTAPFAKWSQPVTQDQDGLSQTAEHQRKYLAVPYGEREAAKVAGAKWDKEVKSWYVGPQGDMERLSRWLPDNVKSQQDPLISPREEFAEAMRSLGCVVSGDHPIMDGKKHRVTVEGDKKGERAGFYVGHLDGHPAGYISNNRTGVNIKWKSKGYSLDPAEKARLQAEAADKLALRTAELEQTQVATAERISQQAANLMPVSEQTPYMKNKGIQPHLGVLTDAEGKKTYIPAYDENGKQWTMQYIQEDGTKRFAKDSRKEGCFHIVGGDMKSLEAVPALVIQEGYATAATNAEALGFVTISAFDSGNLSSVAKALHGKFPDKPVIIFGDDDRHQELTQGTNPGKTKALEAAKAVGGKAVFPVFAPGEADYPADLTPITPHGYREHLQASKALETASEVSRSDLQKGLLSKEQLAALDNMKKHTDFNDLASRSRLGREGVERQVRAAISKAVLDEERKKEQKQVKVHQKKQKRAARIG